MGLVKLQAFLQGNETREDCSSICVCSIFTASPIHTATASWFLGVVPDEHCVNVDTGPHFIHVKIGFVS